MSFYETRDGIQYCRHKEKDCWICSTGKYDEEGKKDVTMSLMRVETIKILADEIEHLNKQNEKLRELVVTLTEHSATCYFEGFRDREKSEDAQQSYKDSNAVKVREISREKLKEIEGE